MLFNVGITKTVTLSQSVIYRLDIDEVTLKSQTGGPLIWKSMLILHVCLNPSPGYTSRTEAAGHF